MALGSSFYTAEAQLEAVSKVKAADIREMSGCELFHKSRFEVKMM